MSSDLNLSFELYLYLIFFNSRTRLKLAPVKPATTLTGKTLEVKVSIEGRINDNQRELASWLTNGLIPAGEMLTVTGALDMTADDGAKTGRWMKFAGIG